MGALDDETLNCILPADSALLSEKGSRSGAGRIARNVVVAALLVGLFLLGGRPFLRFTFASSASVAFVPSTSVELHAIGSRAGTLSSAESSSMISSTSSGVSFAVLASSISMISSTLLRFFSDSLCFWSFKTSCHTRIPSSSRCVAVY